MEKEVDVDGKIRKALSKPDKQKSIYDPLWAFPFKLIWRIIRLPIKFIYFLVDLIFGLSDYKVKVNR